MKDLLERVEAEVSAFLSTPSFSAEFRHIYVSVMASGMRSYFELALRRNFELDRLLSSFTRDIMANVEIYEPSNARAAIQGAMYMKDLLTNVLARNRVEKGENASTNESIMHEIDMGYVDLSMLLSRLVIERDPRIVPPGYRLNINAIRPKNPDDATWN